MRSTLVLNASYEPWNIVSARRGLELVWNDKAFVEDEFEETIQSVDDIYFLPSVIRLKHEVHLRRRNNMGAGAILGFSKRAVYIRDNYRCVYCKKKATTIDHVLPISRGGKTTYENCVASCFSCNSKKGSKLLSEMGWKYPVSARKPLRYEHFLSNVARNTEALTSWSKFVFPWNKELAKFYAVTTVEQTASVI